MSGRAPQDFVNRLGQEIAARRNQLGLSQQELADRLGLSSSETVSRYERGQREPRVTTLLRVALALETSPAALIVQALETTGPANKTRARTASTSAESSAEPAEAVVDTLDLAHAADATAAALVSHAALDRIVGVRPDLATVLATALDAVARQLDVPKAAPIEDMRKRASRRRD